MGGELAEKSNNTSLILEINQVRDKSRKLKLEPYIDKINHIEPRSHVVVEYCSQCLSFSLMFKSETSREIIRNCYMGNIVPQFVRDFLPTVGHRKHFINGYLGIT